MSDFATLASAFPTTNAATLKPTEYDKQIRKFVGSLQSTQEKTLAQSKQLLDSLDPSIQSLPFLYILYGTILQNAGKPQTLKQVPDEWRPRKALWNKAAQFFSSFDPIQVRYAGPQWRTLVEYITRVSQVLSQPAAALEPLRDAILRLDASGGTLTSTHLDFVRLCLESGAYASALPILRCHIHSFPSTTASGDSSVPCASYTLSNAYITVKSGLSEKLNLLNVQEYFLLGALIFLGLRLYSEAQLLLEHVLITPTNNAANGLMLEAYRKWVLISALVTGKRSNPPRTTNSVALKSIRSASKAYDHLAEVFEAGNASRFFAEIEAGQEIWADDGSLGLVQQLADDLPRFALYKLQRTYASIPFAKLATMLGKEEATLQPYLQSLIVEGHLNAAIVETSQPDKSKILRFYTDSSKGPQAKSEKQQYEELLIHTQETNALTEQVQAADHRLSLTKEHLEIERRSKDRARQEASSAGDDHMDTSWDSKDHDEDLMADLQ